MRNFVQVAAQSDEILDLSLEDLQEIIYADDLNVKTEETVWEAILRWIDHDPEGRKEHIVVLMKCIRLGFVCIDFSYKYFKMSILDMH